MTLKATKKEIIYRKVLFFAVFLAFLGVVNTANATITDITCDSISQQGENVLCNISTPFDFIRQKAYSGLYPDESILLDDTGYGNTYNSGYSLVINAPDYSHWFSFETSSGNFSILRAVKTGTTWNAEIEQNICKDLDIICYIKSALTWAFVPSPETWDRFSDLKDELSTKAPFGYVTETKDLLSGLNDTTTATFSLQEVEPITDNIFSPIRTALSWLLYFMFAFYLFNRLKHITI